jgi:hypothetical protein
LLNKSCGGVREQGKQRKQREQGEQWYIFGDSIAMVFKIVSHFLEDEQLSLRLQVLIAKGFGFVQQALNRGC